MINPEDQQHANAMRQWNDLLDRRETFLTTSYVVSELINLAQGRFGMGAVRDLAAEVLPLFDVVWVDSEIHQAAMATLIAIGRRNLSLVDCASFEVMRRRGLRTAFTLDRDFREQGFDAVP